MTRIIIPQWVYGVWKINPLSRAIIGVLQKKSKVDIVNIEFVIILMEHIYLWLILNKLKRIISSENRFSWYSGEKFIGCRFDG